MWRRLVVLGLTACASSPVTPPSSQTVVIAPKTGTNPRASNPDASNDEATVPTQGAGASLSSGSIDDLLEFPKRAACTLSGPRFRGALRVTAQGAPFLTSYGTDRVMVVLPEGPTSAGAVVEIMAFGYRVRGAWSDADVAVHAQRAFRMDDMMVPRTETNLSWTGGGPTGLDVRMDTPLGLRLSTGRAVFARGVPCDALGLEPKSFDPFPAVDPAGTRREVRVTGNATGDIEVAKTPGAKGALSLSLSATLGAYQLSRSGPFAEVVFDLQPALLVGWVAASHVQPGTSSRLGSISTSGFGVGGSMYQKKMVCSEDLPLTLDFEGGQRVVGSIRRGAVAFVGSHIDGQWTSVSAPPSAFRLSAGARLLAPREILERCRRAP